MWEHADAISCLLQHRRGSACVFLSSLAMSSEKCEIGPSFTQVLEAVRLAAIAERSQLSPAKLLGPSLRKALVVRHEADEAADVAAFGSGPL